MAKKKIENGVAEETKTPTTEKKTVRKKASKKVQTTTEVKNPVAEPETDKKALESVATENKVEKQPVALPADESILMYSCRNKCLVEAIQMLAEKQGVQTVPINDKVIDDYISMSTKYDTVQNFLSDSANRMSAKAQAVKLYYILTNYGDMNDSKNRTFVKKQVVRATTLTWNKLDQLFELLLAFGFIVKIDNTTFHFQFDEQDIQAEICKNAYETMRILQNDIERLQASLDVTENGDVEKVTKQIAEFKQYCIKMLK